jgi:hypothetical protein
MCRGAVPLLVNRSSKMSCDMNFDAFMVVKVQTAVFWVATPYSVASG